ncbi:MAG: CoA transferase [Deltaproteobacteria bacterium]|nr:MAG: CoA transferase [Deltaproteobacteria bacterium]
MDHSEFYRDARADLTGPLAGVRVIEATTTWAGPMCGCLLADFGADVIKVEHPDGEVARHAPPFLSTAEAAVSFMHATVNRNKRSLTLDLRQPGGRDVFLRLAERADVVVENFRPGVLARFGLDYAAVRARKPDVVYVSISGYGQYGPDSERAGYDPIAQATSGYLSLNGEPEGRPVKSPTFLADDLAGLHAALGALAALRHRDRTGEGQHVDVSLLDAMLFQSTGYLTLGALGIPLPRMGNEFRIAAPAGVYPCRDGDVMLGVLLDSHWKILARQIGHPELADHPDYATTPARLARRADVNRRVEAWTRERGVPEVVAALVQAGLPAAPVQSYADAARDPHVRARDMLQEVPQEDGQSAPITGPAAKLSRTPLRVRSGAPGLGAQTEEILGELGLDAEQVARLRDARVIR